MNYLKCLIPKATIAYLYAIKLIAPYSNKGDLEFVVKWLRQNITKEGYFNIPSLKADGIIFPRSENWKKKDNKLKDIIEFIKEVLFGVKGC